MRAAWNSAYTLGVTKVKYNLIPKSLKFGQGRRWSGRYRNSVLRVPQVDTAVTSCRNPELALSRYMAIGPGPCKWALNGQHSRLGPPMTTETRQCNSTQSLAKHTVIGAVVDVV